MYFTFIALDPVVLCSFPSRTAVNMYINFILSATNREQRIKYFFGYGGLAFLPCPVLYCSLHHTMIHVKSTRSTWVINYELHSNST